MLKQLRRMSQGSREALERLAVLGEETTSDLLELLAPGSAAGLEAPGVLERRVEGLHQVLAFASPSLREFLYQRLEPERQATLHREIGRALVDRLVHKAHIIETGKTSQRLTEALKRQGSAREEDETER